jgi:hypothetical protein
MVGSPLVSFISVHPLWFHVIAPPAIVLRGGLVNGATLWNHR